MVESDGVIHVIESGTNKNFQLKRDTLSPETLEWYDRAKTRADELRKRGPNAQKANPASNAASSLTEPPPGYEHINKANLDRSKIPSLDQGKYGNKASDCVPNSYAMFLMWWDQFSNLQIPRGRDFDDKAEWIHKELARAFVTRNNSGTSYAKAQEGMRQYFERRHEGVALFKDYREYDIRPTTLAKYTVDSALTVLSLSIYYGDDYDGGHAVSVLRVDENGAIDFNTWGQKFSGQIVSIGPLANNEYPPSGAPNVPRERFEIKLSPLNNIPQWMKDREVRFILDPMRWDSLLVMIPYVKIAQ